MARKDIYKCSFSIGEFYGMVIYGESRHSDGTGSRYHLHLVVSEHIIAVGSSLDYLEKGYLEGISYSNPETGNHMYINSFLMYHILDQCMDGEVFNYTTMIEVVEDVATHRSGYNYEDGDLRFGRCEFNEDERCCHEFCNGNEYADVDELPCAKSARK